MKKSEIIRKLNQLADFMEESAELPYISGYNGQFFLEHHFYNETDMPIVEMWIASIKDNRATGSDIVTMMHFSNKLWRHLNALH